LAPTAQARKGVTMTKEELADRIVLQLNTYVNLDRLAIQALIEHRVPCNDALSMDKTVQVQSDPDTPWSDVVGMLGILNGLVGVIETEGPKKGWGLVTAVYDDNGNLLRFRRTENA
jgi:hypothetical protein